MNITEKKSDNAKNELIQVTKYIKWAIIWIVVAPTSVFIIGLCTGTETGTIGDTIGGVTAPAIGLLAAWLVYKSFSAQIEANKTVQAELKRAHQESNFTFLLGEFEQLKLLCKSLEYKDISLTKDVTSIKLGLVALSHYSSVISCVVENSDSYVARNRRTVTKNDYIMNHWESLLSLNNYNLYSFMVHQNILLREFQDLELSEKQELILNRKLSMFYHENLQFHLNEITNLDLLKGDIKNPLVEEKIFKIQDLSKYSVDFFENLTLE